MNPGPYPERGASTEVAVVRGEKSSSTVRLGPLSGLAALASPGRTIVVADELTVAFVPEGFDPGRLIVVPRGEAAKSLASLESVYGRLLELEAGRDCSVVGLGGGAVSDLAGFAAATWMRGVDSGFAPTTLLSMVDASVGGKNGIDFGGYKNLIGTFNQPRFVLVDVSVLSSLPAFDLACGMAEAIKHGVIEGDAHLALIERAIRPGGAVDASALPAIVEASIRLKASIVGADEREANARRTLNLGHTVGHAIEAASGLPHGAAIAAGLASACRLSVERGGSAADADRVIRALAALGLPTGVEEACAMSKAGADPAAFRAAVVAAIGSDKKRIGDEILFAMPHAIGDVRVEAVALETLREFAGRAP